MNADEALEKFLKGALTRRKERYLGFISRSKSQKKFLETIYHILESDFDEEKSITQLPSVDKPIAGYRFAPPDEFGIPVPDIRDYVETVEDSFLVISQNGSLGIHSPETFIDERAIYRI